MSWSRFFRMCFILIGVSTWTSLTVLVSQAVFSRLIKNKEGKSSVSPTGTMQSSLAPVAPLVPEPVNPPMSKTEGKEKREQKTKRAQVQDASSTVVTQRRPFFAGNVRRNTLVTASFLLVAIIVAQTLVSFHVPLLNVFASRGTNTASSITSTVAPTSQKVVTRVQTFETGIVTPQWQKETAYGADWQQGISDIQSQAGARWIELPLLFEQDTASSTTVHTTESTPLIAPFTAGIRAAHAKGLHVFVVPLMAVNVQGAWAGSINFSTQAQEQQWFNSYWNTIQPYVVAAAQTGADQMAIATECAWLQAHAPSSLWNQLITRIRSIYKGTMTYDMNWYPTNQAIPDWFSNSNLSMIGVSSYIPLTDKQVRIDPAAMVSLWHDKISTVLDSLSQRIGKPVLISEIGYRNSADALYDSWQQDSTTAVDPQEQAGAYNAALTNATADQHIAGIFFWGWENVNRFTLKGQTATLSVLHKWYTSVGA